MFVVLEGGQALDGGRDAQRRLRRPDAVVADVGGAWQPAAVDEICPDVTPRGPRDGDDETDGIATGATGAVSSIVATRSLRNRRTKLRLIMLTTATIDEGNALTIKETDTLRALVRLH